MPKNSAYLARQAARQRALTDEVRRYTIQQCGDFMLLAAAEAFGFGEDRLKRLSDAWATKFDEYADLLIDDLSHNGGGLTMAEFCRNEQEGEDL